MLKQYTSVHDVIEKQDEKELELGQTIFQVSSSVRDVERYVLRNSIDDLTDYDIKILQESCDYLDHLLRKIRDLK